MIVRYQHPYSAFRHFDREFDRLVRRGFGRTATQLSLRADVYTEGRDAVITAAVPGIAPEDVSVTLEGRRLSIGAERRERETAEGDRYLIRGFATGTFRREFTVPEGTESSQVSADVADGILTVRITGALKPEPQAQQIPVGGAQPSAEVQVEEEAETDIEN
ncbi:Hsp20/alpha crystallin family protein [Glycomyces buryatensis]|uniref:Hsp20/alpha crystallin family protein n=1 Tax=Glycomyces buryatensis TaxID=2570927 RepID=A0A4S8QBS3_9ACTN|nr:Hsp20/alpha crystallin family protein [Glycomyces buryatensis]THV41730.1 Hsp20/alpha crystallin family protein [Glycomyces buryatensis]